MTQCPLQMRTYQHDLRARAVETGSSPLPHPHRRPEPAAPPPAAGAPHTTAMRPEHVKQYHLYDGDRVIATGQAALDYPWRPGLILRWLMPPEPERRRISPEARYRGRRRRLQKRLQRQAPLFAAQLEQQILADRPEYYGLPKP